MNTNLLAGVDGQFKALLLHGIEQTGKGVGIALDFIKDQAPDVIRQLLVWKCVVSATYCLLAVALFGLMVFLAYKLNKWLFTADKDGDKPIDDGDVGIPAVLFGNFFIQLLWIPICINANLTWLQILIAPKVWLLEYAASLIK